MVFRRSLVRELTATAVGLFLVLLGILFTNLVLRLLARAAGGTVALSGLRSLEQIERDVILQTLEATRYQISKSAEILGISRKTLLEKRKKYGLQ